MATPPDFTSGAVLTAAQMNSVGLWKVGAYTLSGVTTQFVGVFSSDFTNYLVKIDNFNNGSATTRAITVQMLSATTPATTNYSSNTVVQFQASSLSGSGVAGSSMDISAVSNLANGAGSLELEFFNPNDALNTFVLSKSYTYQSNVTAYVHRNGSHIHATATAYNGFAISGVTDSLSGNVTIYGYRK
jgi:hypothetical protein